MTWIVGILGFGQAHIIADLRVSGPNGPINEFGVAKISPLTHNQIIGFAGSVPIGLTLIHAMRSSLASASLSAPAYQPSAIRAVVPVDLWINTWKEVLEASYETVFPVRWRDSGLELLLVTVSHSPNQPFNWPEATAYVIDLPRSDESGVELSRHSGIGTTVSIGSGADNLGLVSALKERIESSPLDLIGHLDSSVDPSLSPKSASGMFVENHLQDVIGKLVSPGGDVGPILVSYTVDVNNCRDVTWNDVRSLPPIFSSWPVVSNALRRLSGDRNGDLTAVANPREFLKEDQESFGRSQLLVQLFKDRWRCATNEIVVFNGEQIAIPLKRAHERDVATVVTAVDSDRCRLHFILASGGNEGEDDSPRQATEAFLLSKPLLETLIGMLADARNRLQ